VVVWWCSVVLASQRGVAWRGVLRAQMAAHKRIGFEYTVTCEVQPSGTHPQQWKLTLAEAAAHAEGGEVVLFCAPDTGSALQKIAACLHVDVGSVRRQIGAIAPTQYAVCAMSIPAMAAEPVGGEAVDYEFVLSLATTVFETLGPGFCESMYQKALSQELWAHHVAHENERVIPVSYKDIHIGVVRADIVVQKNMVIELKTVAKLSPAHLQQAERYAALLNMPQILVLNFPSVRGELEMCCFRNGWFPLPKSSSARCTI